MVTSGSIAQNKVIVQYLSLLRPKHWIKNAFVFLPLFFSGEIFNIEKLLSCFAGLIAFSFIASAVYILNDYMEYPGLRLDQLNRDTFPPGSFLLFCYRAGKYY